MKTESILKELNDITNRIEVIKKQIEKPEFEVGSYWEHSTGEVCLIFGYEDIHSGTVKCRHISSDSKEFAYHGIYTMKRKLTPTEVQEALEKEAVKRYKDNNRVKCLLINSIVTFDLEGEVMFNEINNSLFCGRIKLFDNGVWATPIKTMSTLDYVKEFYETSSINLANRNKLIAYLKNNNLQIIETLNNL